MAVVASTKTDGRSPRDADACVKRLAEGACIHQEDFGRGSVNQTQGIVFLTSALPNSGWGGAILGLDTLEIVSMIVTAPCICVVHWSRMSQLELPG